MTLSEKKTTLQVLRHLRRISLILLVLVSLAALILNLGRLSADDLGRLAARVRYGFSGKREEASSIVFTESEGKAVDAGIRAQSVQDAEIINGKNRNRPTGSIKMRFDKNYSRFVGIEYEPNSDAQVIELSDES